MKSKWTVFLFLFVPLFGYGQRIPMKAGKNLAHVHNGIERISIENIRYRRIYPVPELKGIPIVTGKKQATANTFWNSLQQRIERSVIGTDRTWITKQRVLVPLYVDSSIVSSVVSLPDQQRFKELLETTYQEALKDPKEWNLRKTIEQKVAKNHLTLSNNALFLDVMSLELYMLKHQYKWPRIGEDPEIELLNKRILQALWDDKLYPAVLALRRQAGNIPSIQAVVKGTEAFIKQHKRMPGLVYLNTADYTGPELTVHEKNLGVDMQFLSVTNLGNNAKLFNAPLAKLIDQWECYYVIALEGGIPEREADGVANIPVYTKAQWQSKLMRWVYTSPIWALLHEPRSYEEILQSRQAIWNTQLANARKQVSEEQVIQWWELMRPEREAELRFNKWNDDERNDALLFAAKALNLQMPQLTHAEWDEYLQQWIDAMGIPRSVILEGSDEDEIPVDALINGEIKIKSFKEMTPLEKREEILGQLYYHHIYPEEYIAKLREANEL